MFFRLKEIKKVINGHGGNIYEVAKRLNVKPTDIIDMSSNLNPLGPPPGLVEHLKDRMDSMISLPEVTAKTITSKLAEQYGIPGECVLAGNGTTQFIYTLPRALQSRRALIVGPTYADYRDACIMHKVQCKYFFARESDDFTPDLPALKKDVAKADTVFICNPNNPTGFMWDMNDLEDLCRSYPETVFVIDESYLPFATDSYADSAIRLKLSNVIILNSMSKVFRIPGLRIGFLLAPLALIYRFEQFLLPWSVNSLAQEAVLFILENQEMTKSFLEETRQFVKREKQLFIQSIKPNLNIRIYPGATYFILGKLIGAMKTSGLCDALLDNRILIRNCSNFSGLDDRFVRFSLKDSRINRMLSDLLHQLLPA